VTDWQNSTKNGMLLPDDIATRLRILYCAADDLTPCGTCLTCQVADEIERLRCDLLMKNRRIEELAAEIDGYKEWIASKGFDWEEADRG